MLYGLVLLKLRFGNLLMLLNSMIIGLIPPIQITHFRLCIGFQDKDMVRKKILLNAVVVINKMPILM